MAAYIDLEPHRDVVTHHTTTAGGFAMSRSQRRITGSGPEGEPVERHHHDMEVDRRLPDGTWMFFIDDRSGAEPELAVARPPHTD